MVWHSYACCVHGCCPGAQIKSPPSVVSIFQRYQNLKNRWGLKEPAGFYCPDLRMVTAAVSFRPFEVTVRVPHGFLQVSLPAGSLFVQTARSTRQADGARGRTPFSAPLDKESCWQAAAERQRHVCPFFFEAQQTLKEQHKQNLGAPARSLT